MYPPRPISNKSIFSGTGGLGPWHIFWVRTLTYIYMLGSQHINIQHINILIYLYTSIYIYFYTFIYILYIYTYIYIQVYLYKYTSIFILWKLNKLYFNSLCSSVCFIYTMNLFNIIDDFIYIRKKIKYLEVSGVNIRRYSLFLCSKLWSLLKIIKEDVNY